MSDRGLARRYAHALFESSKEKNLLDKTEDDLNQVIETVDKNEDLYSLFEREMIAPEDKIAVVEKIFGKDISRQAMNFLQLVLYKRREKYLKEMLEEYMKLADEARGKLEVEAVTGAELTSEQEEMVKQQLSEITGKDVRLKARVDPDLVGGIVIKIGDKVYDRSAKKQLEVLEYKLKSVHFDGDRGEKAI